MYYGLWERWPWSIVPRYSYPRYDILGPISCPSKFLAILVVKLPESSNH
jgi:hypothetical protein